MPTSLSQLQAQGWKKWLSRITFTRRTNYLKSTPTGRMSILPSRSIFKPRLSLCDYADEPVTVLSPRREKYVGIGKAGTYPASQFKI